MLARGIKVIRLSGEESLLILSFSEIIAVDIGLEREEFLAQLETVLAHLNRLGCLVDAE